MFYISSWPINGDTPTVKRRHRGERRRNTNEPICNWNTKPQRTVTWHPFRTLSPSPNRNCRSRFSFFFFFFFFFICLISLIIYSDIRSISDFDNTFVHVHRDEAKTTLDRHSRTSSILDDKSRAHLPSLDDRRWKILPHPQFCIASPSKSSTGSTKHRLPSFRFYFHRFSLSEKKKFHLEDFHREELAKEFLLQHNGRILTKGQKVKPIVLFHLSESFLRFATVGGLLCRSKDFAARSRSSP